MNKSFSSTSSFLAITAFVLVGVFMFSNVAKVSAQTAPSLDDCLKTPSAACAKLTNPKAGISARPAALAPRVLGATTFKFTQTLSLGSKGTDVQQLQTILISEGFLKGTADGKFGKATVAAVKAFQLKNGLATSGSVGPLTRAALNK